MQSPHRMDVLIDDLSLAIKEANRAFLEDNHLTPRERSARQVLRIVQSGLLQYRRDEVASDSLKRNGNTDRTRRLMADAGHTLVDLTAERQARRSNVIELFPDDRNAG